MTYTRARADGSWMGEKGGRQHKTARQEGGFSLAGCGWSGTAVLKVVTNQTLMVITVCPYKRTLTRLATQSSKQSGVTSAMTVQRGMRHVN